MIYLDLPTGDRYGWGIRGDNLANALAPLLQVERLVDRPPLSLRAALLQAVGPDLRPFHQGVVATRRVGYAVFQNDVVARRKAAEELGDFDVVVAASHWAEDVLREGGLTAVVTIQQGIDTTRFNPGRAVRRRYRNRFVIFSGGKFSFRKGQDIVVRAFRAFAERHADALLLAAWSSRWWMFTAPTMSSSPYSPFTLVPEEGPRDSLQRWLASTGVDLRAVELVPATANENLAAVYGDTDVGLFPSRCEGATNLMLMEYMACGRPAICTDFSGHHDLINDVNSLPLRASRPLPMLDMRGRVAGCWCEPDIDEIVGYLEQAYRQRDRLSGLARCAAADIAAWTWERTARAFVQSLSQLQ